MFTGSLVAIVTPFKNGKLDERAFGDLIEWQIRSGTHGIVPCGTTGESATLTHAEHDRVVACTVEVVRGRVPVVAGTGSNSTAEAIALTKHAKAAGVDGALLITPYYNKPTQEGLFLHYKAVAEAVDLPLVLYNIPGRTGVNMTPDPILEAAAGVGKLEAVKSFFTAKGTLKGATEHQLKSAFKWACAYGHIETVEFLLGMKVEINSVHRGEIPLHWACYAGHTDIVRLKQELRDGHDILWRLLQEIFHAIGGGVMQEHRSMDSC